MQTESIEVLKKANRKWLSKLPSVQVITNQYQTRLNNNLKFLRVFEIQIEPEVQKDSHKIFALAVKKMPQNVSKQMNCSIFSRRGYAIWCMAKLQLTKQQQNTLKKIPPRYQIKIEQTSYEIIIKYVKQSQMTNKQNMQLITQHLNVKLKHLILRECKMKQLSKNVFFPKWSLYQQDFKLQVQARIGFKFTLSLMEIQLFCDLNNQIKVMNQKSLLETIYQKQQKLNYYIGKRVMKNYGNRKCFVIIDIVTDKNPLTATVVRNDKEITLYEYFKNDYQIEIKDKKQPLIVVESSSYELKIKQKGKELEKFEKTIFLVPQMVCLVGIPQHANQNFMKSLRMTPNKCIETAYEFIKDVNEHQKEFLISSQNKKAIAYLLPQPQIMINQFTVVTPREGSFKIQTQISSEGIMFIDVLIVYSVGKDVKYDRKQIDDAIKILNNSGKWYNISIKQKFQLQINENHPPEQWIDQIQKDIKQNDKPSFIIIAFKPKQIDLKDVIKRELTYRLGVQSQVFLREKINPRERKSLKIAGNIMKQIAAKNRRRLWRIKELRGYEQKLVLLIGVSVQKVGSKFELVICRNINKDIFDFKTQIFSIDSRQIPVSILEEVFYNSLQDYIKEEDRKFKPTTIIVYRLGINNERYAQDLLQTESRILKQRVKYISEKKIKKGNYDPEIVYIHVLDRPSIKFWIQEEGNQPNSFLPRVVNPQVGTVMKASEQNQFNLVPYKARQGTVQPSFYRVFSNEKKVPMEFIIQFTYARTYMYCNWEGSVRLPEVLQYCKKAHQFVKSKEPNKTFTFNALSFV